MCRLRSRHRGEATMSTADDVRRLLSRAPGDSLCDACLALACASSLDDMRAVTEALAETDPAFQRGSGCGGCGRTIARSSTASVVRTLPVGVRRRARDRAGKVHAPNASEGSSTRFGWCRSRRSRPSRRPSRLRLGRRRRCLASEPSFEVLARTAVPHSII
jgi:hypothetical protein